MIRLSRKRLANAAVCAICVKGGGPAEEVKIVRRVRGWVHVFNNSRRCPGQGDDDTDDKARPLIIGGAARREYVVGFGEDGEPRTLPLEEVTV